MGKSAKHRGKQKHYDSFDDYEDFDYDFDLDEWAEDAPTPERRRFDDNDSFTARRKIERRRDMKRLYSQLDEWEDFGSQHAWD